MTILAFDTSLDACSAAVVQGASVLARCYEAGARGQAERLVPMIQEVMAAAKVTMNDLTAVAVTIGPGAFTGMRIGLSVARGLALVRNCPLIGLTSLEVVAAAAQITLKQQGKDPRMPVTVIHDARRKEVFVQSFAGCDESGLPTALSEAMAIPFTEVGKHVPRSTAVIVGSGVALVAAQLVECDLSAIRLPEVSCPDAGVMGTLAAAMMAGGHERLAEPVRPLYLRAPDAKKPRQISLVPTTEMF